MISDTTVESGPSNEARPNNGAIRETPASTTEETDRAWEKQNLLSLDGGGIRGYWTLLFLDKLMQQIAREERRFKDQLPHSFSPIECPDGVPHDESGVYLPCHYFDFICGSSTGALISIMLGRFRMSIPDCLEEYEKMGNVVFGNPRIFCQRNIGIVSRAKYSAKAMEKAIKDVSERRCAHSESDRAGEVSFAPDLRRRNDICKTFVTTLKSERQGNSKGTTERTYLLRSYDHNEAIEEPTQPRRGDTNASLPRAQTMNFGPAESLYVWQVARAATAATFYFKEISFKRNPLGGTRTHFFSDGGFGANNPTLLGIREIEYLYGKDRVGAVVSVGTSRSDDSDGKGLIARFKKIANHATDPELVADALSGRELYWRFNDKTGIGVELDEWKPNGKFTKGKPGQKTLKKIRDGFTKWYADVLNREELVECAQELVKRRRSRTDDRGRWEIFATCADFACPKAGCLSIQFQSREDLCAHFISVHKVAANEVEKLVGGRIKTWQYQTAAQPRRG